MIKESVLFYSEHWLDGCKALHNKEKQKERLKQWHDDVLNTMENGDVSVRRHAEKTKLYASTSSNDSIRSWTVGALKMMKKLKEHPQYHMQRCFNR